MSQKMKHLCIGLLLAAALFISACAGSKTSADSLLAGDPVVGGISINSVSPLEASSLYERNLTDQVITINGNGTTDTIHTSDILLNSNNSQQLLTTLLKQKIRDGMNGYYQKLNKTLASSVPVRFNESSLADTVASLSCVTEAAPMKNAQVVWDGWEAEIIPEENGSEPDQAVLTEKIRENAINGNGGTIDLAADNVYKKPTVVEDSPVISTAVDNLEKSSETVITYEFGDWPEHLTVADFGDWLSTDENGNVQVDEASVEAYLREFSDWYNVFENRQQAVAEKKTLTGYLINYADETKACVADIQSGTSEDRTLETFSVTSDDVAQVITDENKELIESAKARFGNTFVYISIANQFMWFYKDGQQIAATPVVTGTEDAHDTPKGEFELYYKATDITLKGSNGDGTDYASKVTFWMPFNGDIGIHDASWRSTYGGDIYEYSGSHGCINTPYAQAKLIYENIEPGTKIIVE
ncbi:MAG: L,D-transpeptidase family protein [Eubacteriaceae bacterium]|jgi:lipoprotein-anchoring transpeptidase ErfK/SrfK